MNHTQNIGVKDLQCQFIEVTYTFIEIGEYLTLI